MKTEQKCRYVYDYCDPDYCLCRKKLINSMKTEQPTQEAKPDFEKMAISQCESDRLIPTSTRTSWYCEGANSIWNNYVLPLQQQLSSLKSKRNHQDACNQLRHVLSILQERVDNPHLFMTNTSGLKECWNLVSDSINSIEVQQNEGDKMNTLVQSKYSNSEIGSHHWSDTLLSYIMRVGEYMNDHETKEIGRAHV